MVWPITGKEMISYGTIALDRMRMEQIFSVFSLLETLSILHTSWTHWFPFYIQFPLIGGATFLLLPDS